MPIVRFPESEAEVFELGSPTELGSTRPVRYCRIGRVHQCVRVGGAEESLSRGAGRRASPDGEAAGVGEVLQLRLVDTGGGDTRGAARSANLPPQRRKQATSASPTRARTTTTTTTTSAKPTNAPHRC